MSSVVFGIVSFFKGDERVVEEPTAEEILSSITLFRLLEAYKKAVDRAPKQDEMVIEQINWTVEEQAEYILETIGKSYQITMIDLFAERSRMWITVTFLALLELIKDRRVGFHQEDESEEVIFYEV